MIPAGSATISTSSFVNMTKREMLPATAHSTEENAPKGRTIAVKTTILLLVCSVLIVLSAYIWFVPIFQASYHPASENHFFEPGEDKVNINTAGSEDLMLLPGIGAVKAQAIIEWRKTNGPFISEKQLTQVHGIGDKTLAGLKEYIEF